MEKTTTRPKYGPEKMHILIAGDAAVLPGLEALIYSTMLHNTDVIWHLCTMDVQVEHGDGTGTGYFGIGEDDAEWLRKIVRFLDWRSDLIRHDTRELYDKCLKDSVNRETGFTPYSTLRLLADQILEGADACLYLDADILVQGDLRPLWDACRRAETERDYAAYTIPEACENQGEMISAVLYFDLARIRKSGFLKRAIRNYNRNPYRYPDQMALADAGEPAPIGETYNYMRDHKMATYKPVVLHFSNGNRYKLYGRDPDTGGPMTKAKFYKYYPEHKYIQEGLELIKTAH